MYCIRQPQPLISCTWASIFVTSYKNHYGPIGLHISASPASVLLWYSTYSTQHPSFPYCHGREQDTVTRQIPHEPFSTFFWLFHSCSETSPLQCHCQNKDKTFYPLVKDWQFSFTLLIITEWENMFSNRCTHGLNRVCACPLEIDLVTLSLWISSGLLQTEPQFNAGFMI